MEMYWTNWTSRLTSNLWKHEILSIQLLHSLSQIFFNTTGTLVSAQQREGKIPDVHCMSFIILSSASLPGHCCMFVYEEDFHP